MLVEIPAMALSWQHALPARHACACSSRTPPAEMLFTLTSLKGIRSDIRDLAASIDALLGRRPEKASSSAKVPATPGQLILLRHGQSVWNLDNRFTGWANVDLTQQGREEAMDAAEMLLSEEALQIDVCYTSVLRRSVQTADICLDALEAAGRHRPEVLARWRLNERYAHATQPLP